MNTIVFSKDRPFQLYSLIETYKKHVKCGDDTPNLIVQFLATDDRYMYGYLTLNEMFDDVEFVDEREYGFQQTFGVVVDEYCLQDEWMSFESDDAVYFRDINVKTLQDVCDNQYKDTCGRLAMSVNVDLFDAGNFDIINKLEGYAVVDRTAPMKDGIQEMCLKYPFGVQGALSRSKDVKSFLNRTVIPHPIATEIEGTQFHVFVNYKHVLMNPVQTCVFCHFNNVLKRYDETHTNEYLLELFTQGKVVDWDKVNIPELEPNMKWFTTGNTDGRPFPIFPWDVDPKYHKWIIDGCLKSI